MLYNNYPSLKFNYYVNNIYPYEQKKKKDKISQTAQVKVKHSYIFKVWLINNFTIDLYLKNRV